MNAQTWSQPRSSAGSCPSIPASRGPIRRGARSATCGTARTARWGRRAASGCAIRASELEMAEQACAFISAGRSLPRGYRARRTRPARPAGELDGSSPPPSRCLALRCSLHGLGSRYRRWPCPASRWRRWSGPSAGSAAGARRNAPTEPSRARGKSSGVAAWESQRGTSNRGRPPRLGASLPYGRARRECRNGRSHGMDCVQGRMRRARRTRG